jgi:hypothetical protein
MNYSKGDKVRLQDGSIIRNATVVADGLDSQNRVRVRPDGIPLDMSVSIEKNNNVYVIQ